MFQRSLSNRLWYRFLQWICRLTAVLLFRARCAGENFVPHSGGALLLSNHQSNLDPVLVGLVCQRRLNYIARQTLFKFAPFRWLIDSLDAIPIDREGTGLGGLKETLKRLKRGEIVLIFPEGTRTTDGEVSPLKPGFVSLAKRAGVPLVPVAVDGAFQAWPRSQKLPRRGVIHIVFGPPMMPADLESLDDRAIVDEIERRIRVCHSTARIGRQRSLRGAC